MKISFKNWKKEAPREIQGVASLLLAEAAAIGGYGLAINIKWAGYVRLGCAILGTLLEKLTAQAIINEATNASNNIQPTSQLPTNTESKTETVQSAETDPKDPPPGQPQ